MSRMSEQPLNEHFNEFIRRVVAASGVEPSQAMQESMRAFFLCGANAAIDLLMVKATSRETQVATAQVMAAEISAAAFFRVISELGTSSLTH